MSPLHKTSLRLLATWFGCGLAPLVPGTVGTIGAMPLVWALSRLGDLRYLYVSFAFAVFSILVAHLYEFEVAGAHDTPELVIDEVAGFLVTMALAPINWRTMALGFVLFRAFDMIKPFPISYVDQKMPGGVGAVADDLLAGIAAGLVLQFALQYGYVA